jgi:hypothetical protein
MAGGSAFSRIFLAFFAQLAITSITNAAGPYGNIHVGNWKGGRLHR